VPRGPAADFGTADVSPTSFSEIRARGRIVEPLDFSSVSGFNDAEVPGLGAKIV
tara:strand:+ start:254 stop:415 length:162 start_codon:yes stop_codon:yes gene_type:complete